jgi:hypothetical protein
MIIKTNQTSGRDEGGVRFGKGLHATRFDLWSRATSRDTSLVTHRLCSRPPLHAVLPSLPPRSSVLFPHL